MPSNGKLGTLDDALAFGFFDCAGVMMPPSGQLYLAVVRRISSQRGASYETAIVVGPLPAAVDAELNAQADGMYRDLELPS